MRNTKKTNLISLTKQFDIDYFEELNKNDLSLCDDDEAPIFKIAQDESLVINYDIPGSSSLEYFLSAVNYEEDYSLDALTPLLGLVLNRDLTLQDKQTLKDAIIMSNYAYDHEDLYHVIAKHTIPPNDFLGYYFRPIYLYLFLRRSSDAIRGSFWDDCKEVLQDCLDVANIVLRAQ